MASKLKENGNLLEPYVGTGNLLQFVSHSEIDVFDIKKEYLDKIENKNVNINLEDLLFSDNNKLYDNIIMNPPYIRTQD